MHQLEADIIPVLAPCPQRQRLISFAVRSSMRRLDPFRQNRRTALDSPSRECNHAHHVPTGITMSRIFDTPQDAEDAYYDALEEGDLDALLAVWDTTDDIICLLPMHPLAHGRSAVRDVFTRLFARGQGIALSVKHLGWIDAGKIAIHQVEESPQGHAAGGQPPMAVYGTNIYRHGTEGWRLIIHQNAPTAPPAGRTPPMAR